MGSLSDIIQVNISASTATAKQANFGTPIIIGQSQRFADVVRSYSDPDGMIDDGFLATDPEVLAASALCSQSPRPPIFKVARRALPPTPVLKVSPTAHNSMIYRLILEDEPIEYTADGSTSATEISLGLYNILAPGAWTKNHTYSLNDTCKKSTGRIYLCIGAGTSENSDTPVFDGTSEAASITDGTAVWKYMSKAPIAWVKATVYTVGTVIYKSTGRKYICTVAGTSQNSDSPTFAGTEETASITDGTVTWKYCGVVPMVANNTTYLTLTSPIAGGFFACEVDDNPSTVGHSGLRVEWNHVDPGIATDLAAIKVADADWYAFCLTSFGTAEVEAAAAWAETYTRLFVQSTPETQSIDTSATTGTDAGNTIKGRSDYRTSLQFHALTHEFMEAALMASRLVLDAGSETWADAQLAGITGDRLTETHITNLKARNMNYITDFGGLIVTRDGKTAGGEWVDVIRGRDWLESDLQSSIYTAQVAAARSGKLPFTNKGIGAVEAQVRASLQRAEARGFIDKGSASVTVPDIADVSTADKSARSLTGVKFSARLAGAIQSAVITGTVVP